MGDFYESPYADLYERLCDEDTELTVEAARTIRILYDELARWEEIFSSQLAF